MDQKPRRATIRQVASAAGVSTQTVSRVINDRPDVSPETRKRVQGIINQLSYRPSAIARSLIYQRSFTIGVVTAGLNFIGPSRTLSGISHTAEDAGYSMLMKELPHFKAQDILPIFQTLISHHVDGIIWAVPEVGENRLWLDELSMDQRIPVVYLTMRSRADISVVTIDNYAGGVLATQHLLDIGRKHIAHLSGPLDWWEAYQRKQAWKDTLDGAGYHLAERHSSEGNWSSASAQSAFLHLLDTYPEMDAVFVANDQMALTVLRIACEKGIYVPDDLAIVGYDNIDESAYFWPALTTIDQNHNELGCQAVQALVSKIKALHENKVMEPKNILLTPALVIRESSVRA